MGRLSAFCISGQTWRSYVGILQRMPKPGPFASLACTLSEHLRARPKHLHLQGGRFMRIESSVINCLLLAAYPLDLNSKLSFCNTVIVIYQKDFSTLSHILFLQIQSLRRYTPLEMTFYGRVILPVSLFL